jgi:hypothetical protein
MISDLKPGQSIWISGDSKTWVTVERSGNGKTLRYVRNTPMGSVVFRSVAF